jgi:hypothetical protein
MDSQISRDRPKSVGMYPSYDNLEIDRDYANAWNKKELKAGHNALPWFVPYPSFSVSILFTS